MGLPNINIEFKTQAISAIKRSAKGIVAIILKDAEEGVQGAHTLINNTKIPAGLDVTNKDYINQAFMGYINVPRKILLYVLPKTGDNLSEALNYFATQVFDYIVAPPDCSPAEASEIVAWVKSMREENDFTPKAVLPDIVADSEAIINFTTNDIKVKDKEYETSGYCARIAGLIAGTPMTVSCTYAPLTEVTDVKRLSKDQMDEAIDNGEFIIFHDGEKVKVGRGINSLKTTTQDKGDIFKKIKIVEAVDMIKNDIKITAQDSYIGKYANSYDNKCLLMTAISGYFTQLELDGILQSGVSSVGIDMEAQEAYLQSVGKDTSEMTEQEIKEANTSDKVFLKASVKILDAIEDINLGIVI